VEYDTQLISFVDSNGDVFELRGIQEGLGQGQCVLTIKKEISEKQKDDLIGILGDDSKTDVNDLCIKAQFLELKIASLDFSEQEVQANEIKKADSVFIQELQEKNVSFRRA